MNVVEMDRIQVRRTYDTATALGLVCEQVCPDFLRDRLQELINECYMSLPEVVTFKMIEDN